MKKILQLATLFALAFLSGLAGAQMQPTPMLGNGYYAVGTDYLPMLAPNGATPPVILPPTQITLYGSNPTGVASGTYTSGITATGTVGQTCLLTSFNDSSTATASIALTGTNTIVAGTPLTMTTPGTGATLAPTSATAGNGTATCSGTATIATVLGVYSPFAVDANGNLIISGGGTTTSALTINNSGSGAASGTTFNGSAPITISYNTLGAAPATTALTATSPSAGVAAFTGTGQAMGAANGNQLNAPNYIAGGGTAQAQTATLSPAIAALVAGQTHFCFLPNAANTSAAPTLAVNGLTATAITKVPNNAALVANDLITTAPACVIYDGTQFELQNPQTAAASGGGNYVNIGSAVTWTQTGGTGAFASGVFTVATAGSAITISSIPGTYLNLELDIIGAQSGSLQYITLQFNGISTSTYHWAQGYATQGTASGLSADLVSAMNSCQFDAASSTDGSAVPIKILGYANGFSKNVSAVCNDTSAGALYTGTVSGKWDSGAAITSIKIALSGGANFSANDQFILYATN